jgi:hypothetical protein
MREVLCALEWVRGEMWRFSSPDFIRQREAQRRVEELCARLVRGGAPWPISPAQPRRGER